MKEICRNKDCTGCGLCASLCAKKCITMKPIDNFGHLYPVIDHYKCADCGLCQKVCPSLHALSKHYPLQCYAAWSKDESDYKSSTSGGAASVLSQHIINRGGVVYGCAMLPDVEVKHIRVDCKDDLYKLKGSKYVQSNLNGVLPFIKKDVKEGREVLFTGTPCQCAAVRNLFKEQPENLYLVDLICHGVPSLKFLQNHVRKVAGTIHADDVKFRDGMGMYVVVVVDGEIRYKRALREPRYDDLYFNTFFDGFTYRDSCYACKYASPERAFDITIGDFWGLGKKTPANEIPDHKYGCSVILPSSEKGKKLIDSVGELINLYPREVKEAVDGNDQLRSPYKVNWRINAFRKLVHIGVSAEIYRLLILDKNIKLRLRKLIKV